MENIYYATALVIAIFAGINAEQPKPGEYYTIHGDCQTIKVDAVTATPELLLMVTEWANRCQGLV